MTISVDKVERSGIYNSWYIKFWNKFDVDTCHDIIIYILNLCSSDLVTCRWFDQTLATTFTYLDATAVLVRGLFVYNKNITASAWKNFDVSYCNKYYKYKMTWLYLFLSSL